MNTTANISNKGDNRVNETSVYQAWRAHLDAVLAEAGVTLVPRSISDSSRVYGLKDTETDVSMGATITMQEYAIRTIEANLLRSALADAEERAMEPSGVKPDVDMAERRFTRRMRRNLNRLEPTLAYLNGRLYDILKDSPEQVSAVYGIMKGETEPSAFIAVTEPGRTPSGETLGELDVWVYIDWEEWHIESVAEAQDMGKQAERLAQWANELAELLTQIGGLK